MRTSRRLLAPVLAPVLATAFLVAGCAGDGGNDDGGDTTSSTSQQQPVSSELLERHDLDGLDTAEVVERLDAATEKPELMASVRYDELQVEDGSGSETLPIDDEFYLSVAPYVRQTHECYFHSLTTCQGELVEEELDVTITDSSGEVLVDETVTTYANGFVGFWLPRDIEATLEVSYDGKSATQEIATGPEDPTCVTTMQLA